MNKHVDAQESRSLGLPAIVDMKVAGLVRVFLCGVLVGILVAVSAVVMDRYVFSAVLCRPQAASDCSQAPFYAMIVAMVIGAIAGVAGLVRLRIYRPLLVVLAGTLSLWGIVSLVMDMHWVLVVLVMGLLFGLVYALYAWVSRLRSFVLAAVVAVVAIVVIRLALVA